MDADRTAEDEHKRVIARATEVLRQHTADADGWCVECMTVGRRLALHPCEHARWAAAVSAAFG